MKIIALARGKSNSLKTFQTGVKSAFSKIKEEIEDHLIAINENTNEISSNYEYICELESKIEKLTERIDQLQLTVYGQIQAQNKEKFSQMRESLSNEEQKVFTALYTLEEEKGTVTFEDIAESTELDVESVSNHIASLMDKKIPISKRFIDNKPYLKIDKDFKRLQAKENVLRIVH